MADRYFVENGLRSDLVALDGAEAHHLIHVMRASPGVRVVLFDGTGVECSAVVQRIGRNEVTLSIESRQTIDRELPFDLTLGVALPKGDRQKWLVEKAVELGVARLVPLQTQRGVAEASGSTLVRLRRAVVEASKQCGRNRLMQIEQPQSWTDYVENGGAAYRWLAHPGGSCKLEELSKPRDYADVRLAVGPEGGLTDDEVALAIAAGWSIVDLGPRILRVETAAIALAAKLLP